MAIDVDHKQRFAKGIASEIKRIFIREMASELFIGHATQPRALSMKKLHNGIVVVAVEGTSLPLVTVVQMARSFSQPSFNGLFSHDVLFII
jgi:hypothetical protein